MQRNFKLILSLTLVLASSINMFSQENVEYKDVVLDGKPAKLNVATGEITLVTAAKPKKELAEKTVATEVESEVNVHDHSSDFHIVKEGETLLDISRHYNVSLGDLKKANNLETTLINKGQQLRVKNFDTVSYTATNSNKTYEYSDTSTGIHIVEKGETLYALSRRYNLSVSELKSNNNLNSNTIKIGQRLKVGDINGVSQEGSTSVWTVSKGDTLYNIARKNGTTVSAIKQLNGLTSNIIKIGQKLQLQ